MRRLFPPSASVLLRFEDSISIGIEVVYLGFFFTVISISIGEYLEKLLRELGKEWKLSNESRFASLSVLIIKSLNKSSDNHLEI